MSTKLIKITSLTLMLWLFNSMAITTLAQSENEQVLDTKGNPLESSKKYYIKPIVKIKNFSIKKEKNST